MINTFIAAFVALFFWGKSTQDVEEKTEHASGLRTLVYLVLSVLVGVFFYKTYQVVVVYNIVDVDGVRQSYNQQGNVADTVSVITITNKIKTGGIVNNAAPSFDPFTEERRYKENGGVYVKIYMPNDSLYTVKTSSNYHNPDFSFLKFYDVSQVYQISAVCTSIPSLIPLYPSWEGTYEESEEDHYAKLVVFDVKKYPERLKGSYSMKSVEGKEKKVDLEKNPFENGYYTTGLFAQKGGSEEPYSFYHMSASGNFLNTMNFFTAADISQYIQSVQVTSSCPVKLVEVVYDTDIEVVQYDSCMKVGPWGFGITGEYLDNFVNNKNGSGILVKLPTLANLQLIRSLILTTLITALLSLFFSNFYYLVRRWAVRFREKHIQAISEVRVKNFKRKMVIILYLILLLILWISWRIYTDSPFHIPIYIDNYMNVIILVIILAFMSLIFFMFRKAYTRKKKK